ncbi:MAG: PHP domain-containing protein [Clostridia bacterium]|nr:PHP domain-containing protein [Clostridia bacterium]
MEPRLIDLHVHSKHSDGNSSLNQIAQMSKENNVGVISLTEHYTLASLTKFRRIVGKSMEVIPGVELSSSLLQHGLSKKHVCHVISYFSTTKIYSVFDEYELSRKKCVKKTLELLKKDGINLSYTKVLECARNPESVGRFDIAIALHRHGYAKTPSQAYTEFFDTSSHIYVDREKMEIDKLIKSLIECGGVPVLAHPKTLRLNESDMREFIILLKNYGLQGMEVYNPHNSDERRNFYLELCNEFDLVPTVGSDFHGRNSDNVEIGLGMEQNLCISDYDIVRNLKERKHKLFD